MKTSHEFGVLNPNYLTIYTDRRLAAASYYYSSPREAFDKKASEWVLAIFCLPGVETVYIDQHSLAIMKGKMFSWDDIIAPALDILWEEFAEECY